MLMPSRTSQYMRMVVYPESPPDVLDDRSVLIVHHRSVFPDEDEQTVEQKVIDVVDDSSCTVIPKRASPLLTLASRKRYTAGIMDVDHVSKRA